MICHGSLGATGAGARAGVCAPLAGEVVPADVLWSCTTCGACVEQCPVDIEHVDRVIDVRRQQVLMESAFPKELGGMFRKLESKGNPWGLAPRKRMDWAKGLDFEVPVIGVDVEDASEVDYLFWVGCAGAYEDRAKRTTRAVAELLHTAGVSFAVLGDAETCTGDPARRAGNEILYQMLAGQNVETLTEAKAQRIVVTCAHCFNTISREYPQIGGRFEVLHHTQLLKTLIDEGRLTVETGTFKGKRITFHDPCYLGRANKVYNAPRELLSRLEVDLVEMKKCKSRAMCCGAGGAQMFKEAEKGDKEINVLRTEQALEVRPDIIATACPFCNTMMTDGVKTKEKETQVKIYDIAELMANENTIL